MNDRPDLSAEIDRLTLDVCRVEAERASLEREAMDHGIMHEKMRAALFSFATKRPGERWTLIRADGHEDMAEVVAAREVLEFIDKAEPGAA